MKTEKVVNELKDSLRTFWEKHDLLFGKVSLYYYFLLLKNENEFLENNMTVCFLKKEEFLLLLLLLLFGFYIFFYNNYLERINNGEEIHETFFNKIDDEYCVLALIVCISRMIGILDNSEIKKFLTQVVIMFLGSIGLIMIHNYAKLSGGFKIVNFVSVSLSIWGIMLFRHFFINHLFFRSIVFLILFALLSFICSTIFLFFWIFKEKKR